MKHLIYLPLMGSMWLCAGGLSYGQTMEREVLPVLYQHPGLTVDLGVGLWAWPLPMDYDLDGDLDLVVSCPDVPFNGLYFFENSSGTGVRYPVFEAPVKIGPGQKNMQISYVNGAPRILGRGVEYLRFRDSVTAMPLPLFPRAELEKEFESIRFSQWKYVDYEGDGDLDLMVGIDDWGDYGWDNAFDSTGQWTNGPLHGYVLLLENMDGTYRSRGKIMAGDQAIDVYGAPSPNMEDFDGDGDLDLICGEFLDRFTWFENTGTRTEPVFAEGRFLRNARGIVRMDLQMEIPSAIDWDGDGDVDLVVGDEDGRVALLENAGKLADGMPLFLPPVYFQQKAGRLKFGALATPCAVDWDSDGDQDLICGNTAGYIGFIENMGGKFPPRWNKPEYLKAGGQVIRIMAGDHGSIQGPAEKKWGYTTLSVADWDGDGLSDILVNSIWGKVIWYKNTGTLGNPRLGPAQTLHLRPAADPAKPAWNWWDPGEGQLVTQWRTTPLAHDWNRDGLMDLVMLDPEGYLCLYERYREHGELFLSPGKRIFYEQKRASVDAVSGPLRLNVKEAGGSGRRKICLADWDQDGDTDLLVNGINASLYLNEGTEGEGVFFRHMGPLADRKLAGHSTSPTVVDWNQDAVPDLLLGAEDGHFYYYENDRGDGLKNEK